MATNELGLNITSKDSTKPGIDSARGSLESLKSTVTALSTAYLAVRRAVEDVLRVAGDMVNEYAGAELAQKSLELQLRRVGDTTNATKESFQQLGRQLQEQTVYDDDAVTSSGALLMMYGRTADEVKGLLPFLTDLASMMSLNSRSTVSLETATQTYLRALEGQGRGLIPYGINIDDVTMKSKDATAITNALKDAVQGAGVEFKNTATGGIEDYKNSLGNFKEAVGEFTVKNQAFIDFIYGLKSMFELMTPSAVDPELLKLFKELNTVASYGNGEVREYAKSFKFLETSMSPRLLMTYAAGLRQYSADSSNGLARVENRIEGVITKTAEYIVKENAAQEAARKAAEEAKKKAEADKLRSDATARLNKLIEDGKTVMDHYQKSSVELNEAMKPAQVAAAARAYKSHMQSVTSAWQEYKKVLQETNDLIADSLSQNLAGLLTGEDVDFGQGLLSVLRNVLAELIKIAIQTIFIRALMGLFTGGIGAVKGMAGATMGASDGIAKILPSMQMGQMLQGGTVINVSVTEPFPLTSDYEKGKIATKVVSKLQSFQKKTTYR